MITGSQYATRTRGYPASPFILRSKNGARSTAPPVRPPSHGSGLGVRRGLSLACLIQHRPGHDPLVPLTSSCPGTPRPTSTLAPQVPRVLSATLFLPAPPPPPHRLISEGPAPSASKLTKASESLGWAGQALDASPDSGPAPTLPALWFPPRRPGVPGFLRVPPRQVQDVASRGDRVPGGGGGAPPERGQDLGRGCLISVLDP